MIQGSMQFADARLAEAKRLCKEHGLKFTAMGSPFRDIILDAAGLIVAYRYPVQSEVKPGKGEYEAI